MKNETTKLFWVNEKTFAKLDEFVIGYENEETFFFSDKEMKEIFGTPEEMAKKLKEYPYCDTEIDDNILSGTQYYFNEDEKTTKYHLYQKGMLEPMYCTIEEFFGEYEPNSIYIGDNQRGYSNYEPVWKWDMTDAFEGTFLERGEDITKVHGCVVEWEEFWEIEGKRVKVLAEDECTQGSHTYYTIVESQK